MKAEGRGRGGPESDETFQSRAYICTHKMGRSFHWRSLGLWDLLAMYISSTHSTITVSVTGSTYKSYVVQLSHVYSIVSYILISLALLRIVLWLSHHEGETTDDHCDE